MKGLRLFLERSENQGGGMIVGSTVENCSVHGQSVYVIVEIKNSTARTTLKMCKNCLERKQNEEDYWWMLPSMFDNHFPIRPRKGETWRYILPPRLSQEDSATYQPACAGPLPLRARTTSPMTKHPRLNKRVYYFCKLHKNPNMGKIRFCCHGKGCKWLGQKPKTNLIQIGWPTREHVHNRYCSLSICGIIKEWKIYFHQKHSDLRVFKPF